MQAKELKEFANPKRAHYPLALFVLDTPSIEPLCDQLEMLYHAGFLGVVLGDSEGIWPPITDGAWDSTLRALLKKAKELGMSIYGQDQDDLKDLCQRCAIPLWQEDGFVCAPHENATLAAMRQMLFARFASQDPPRVLGTFSQSARGYLRNVPYPNLLDEPFFSSFDLLSTWFARVQFLLSQGEEACEVLLFEGEKISLLLSDCLKTLQIGFRTVSTHVLLDATLENGKMHTSQGVFTTLLLPVEEGLDPAIDAKVRDFAAGGGRVLCFSQTLTPVSINKFGKGQWRVVSLPAGTQEVKAELLAQLNEFLALARKVKLTGEQAHLLFTRIRYKEGQRIAYLYNPTKTAIHVQISCEGFLGAALCHLNDGTISALSSADEESTSFPLSVPAHQGIACILQKPAFESPAPALKRSGRIAFPVDGWSLQVDGGNTLPLPIWEMKVTLRGAVTRVILRSVFGMAHTLGEHAPFLQGVCLHLPWELPPASQVYIDGHEVACQPLQDGLQALIGPHIRVGDNVIEVRLTLRASDGPPLMPTQPASLRGDFRVMKRGEQFSMLPPEALVPFFPLSHLGYGFFAGKATYSREFTLQQVPPSAYLRFEKAQGVLEVYINGIHCGTRAWQPWEFFVSPYLQAGKNILTLCVKTAQNPTLPVGEAPFGLDGIAYFEWMDEENAL